MAWSFVKHIGYNVMIYLVVYYLALLLDSSYNLIAIFKDIIAIIIQFRILTSTVLFFCHFDIDSIMIYLIFITVYTCKFAYMIYINF